MRKSILILIAILFSSTCLHTTAQSFEIKAQFDSVAMFIGDQATLSFIVTQEQQAKVQLPELNQKALGKLEIVESLKNDTIIDGEQLKVTHSFKVTSFDSTLALIPQLPFICGTDTQYSNVALLKVVDVPIDTTQMAIADIKPILEPPFDYHLLYTIIAIVLIVIVLAFVIYVVVKKIRNRKEAEIEEEYVDPRSAIEIAIENFEALKTKELYQCGKTKEYYTELVDILRKYFNKKYDIDALESTSQELIEELKKINIVENKNDFNRLVKRLLEVSDLVKFAKYVPEMRECENDFTDAQKIIDIDNSSSIVETTLASTSTETL